MTTIEILDALEAGILALRSRNGDAAPQGQGSMAPAELRAAIPKTAMSPGEFARALGVAREELEAWLDDAGPVPSWVPAAIRLLGLLTPSARRTLLNGSAKAPARPNRSHPFSRIEEL